MSGRDGSGKLKTILGTDNYMAPEIHSKAPYIGSSVDLFAAGIILFIFFTGHPPFNHAKATDSYYNLICMNNHERFWTYHARKKPNGINFFSPDFISLVNAMLAFDPTQRLSIAEIKAHPWYKGEVPTSDQVESEFSERKAKVDAEVEKKKKEIEMKKQQAQARTQPINVAFQGIAVKNRDVTVVQEGADDILLENNAKIAEQVRSIKLERSPPVYVERGTKCMTNHYSAMDAETMLKVLVLISNNICKDVELNTDRFKVTARVQGKDDAVTVDMRVYASDVCSVVEFNKKDGSIFEYQKAVEKIREELEKLEKDNRTDA